jgi:hypothetical protein
MKEFLAVYLGSPESEKAKQWNALDGAERQRRANSASRAWHAWMDANKAAIVVTGGPLGKTWRADSSGVSAARNNLTGYIVIRAESLEAAARLFEQHPHFAQFPGESVEIMECMPIPPQP